MPSADDPLERLRSAIDQLAAFDVDGLVAEARAEARTRVRSTLVELMEHATQRQFVHAHKWRQGDLVIWDNRCTMHRARPFDTTKVRDLRRVTTRDVASTLEQAA